MREGGEAARMGLMTRLGVGLVLVYQRVVSPLLPPACRYVPSCSEYARRALARHGLIRGGLLAAGRLLRCNPLYPGGFDPVPGEEGAEV